MNVRIQSIHANVVDASGNKMERGINYDNSPWQGDMSINDLSNRIYSELTNGECIESVIAVTYVFESPIDGSYFSTQGTQQSASVHSLEPW